MSIDWPNVLIPDASPLEIILRGTIMYLALFVLLRVILKRQAGTLGMTDLLLVTLLADASQNAMAGDYNSVPDGLVLVATLIFWNYSLDWLSFRSPLFRRLIEPAPLPLVQDGRMRRRNMRRELITEEELMGQVREQGIDDLSRVAKAFRERDGRISVIQREEKQHGKRGNRVT
jgi:uncharacterized membrane protein YcaP (DUF421 family)